MRLCLLVVLVCAAGAAGCGGTKHAEPTTAPGPGTSPRAVPARFRVSLSAPTHTPPAGKARWWYVVRATTPTGRPLHGLLTVAVVDPLGTAHVADVGTTTRKLRNYPFSGRYRDFAQWPAASRGYRLTFRVTVRALGNSQTLSYWVKPR
ncbi:MAG TPA: hypothetical protein VE757_04725 [Gaiellaceae bacterium]|nr:hypothetical protein [Gaiellaceae bacterium]